MAYSHRAAPNRSYFNKWKFSFLEGSDNFETEKSIPIKHYGDKIFYLQQKNQWITVNSTTVHFWNLKDKQSLKEFPASKLPPLWTSAKSIICAQSASPLLAKTRKSFQLSIRAKREKQSSIWELPHATLFTIIKLPDALSLFPTLILLVYSIEGNQFDP